VQVGEAQCALVEGGDDQQRPLVADLVEDPAERPTAVAPDHAGVSELLHGTSLCVRHTDVPFASRSIVTHHVATYDR
jgi:hypothetical protein